MDSREPTPQKLTKSLRRKQRKHRELLARVERTATRLDRRRKKLREIETRIAELERRLAEPRKEGDRRGGLKAARLIFNPSSGPDHGGDNAERLAEIVQSLRTHGIEPDIGLKTSGKAARALAREAVRDGERLVVVAAGDGTVEDVASELVGSATAIGIVPIGTYNNLARSLGVPIDIDEACALIAMGTVRHIDVGRVFSSETTEPSYFLEGAGLGLTALAAAAGQAIEKHRWRMIPGAVRKLFDSKPGTIRIEMDGTAIEANSNIVTVSNSPMMGSNLLVAPDARMDDGWLDIVVYDGMSDAALVQHFAAASSGSPEKLKTYRARRVRIVSDERVPASADKDPAGQQRVVEIEILPRALCVIAGNGIGLGLPVEAAPRAALPVEKPHSNGRGEAAIPGPEHAAP
ncbi:MAG TPA: diacylglycerol kinase family protein [Candidatus Udaeobacter sp.]|jgi:diacylglycerol kinase (ATP)|nr:diacylglycerol kinase family protein [Candidatus Udaeobacter sp.]